MACGILVPDQGLNPYPFPWEHRVLTTGLVGNSLSGSNIVLVFFLSNLAFPRGNGSSQKVPIKDWARSQSTLNDGAPCSKERNWAKKKQNARIQGLLLGFPAEGYFEVEKMVSWRPGSSSVIPQKPHLQAHHLAEPGYFSENHVGAPN